jgi:hypothetical protein
MTPFLHRLYKFAQEEGAKKPSKESRALVKSFQEALSFECSDVLDLAHETAKAVAATVHQDNKQEPVINHGGLLVLPHSTTWVEWMGEHARGRVGVIICEEPDGDYSLGILPENSPGEYLACLIKVLPDDECKIVAYKNENKDSAELAALAGYVGQIVLAMLIIINAPYGIDQDVQPLHKAWARDAAKSGFQLKAARRIYLNKTKAPPAEYLKSHSAYAGAKFHKAFHFVRSHLRHFKGGGHTMIKAHWRGDPRLGIRAMPEYKLKP